MTPSFIHLRTHTEYSLIDSTIFVDDLVSDCRAMHMPAIGVTDHMNLFAAIKFYKAAQNNGIKPILGTDILLANPQEKGLPFRLTLLCQNLTGYHNLTRLITKAYQETAANASACVRKEWLTPENCQGLIALSGAREGDIGAALLENNGESAQQLLTQWQQLFPNRFYLELQRTGRGQEEDYIHGALRLAQKFNAPVVATNDVRFRRAEDFEAHEARVCIHAGFTLEDPRRPRHYAEQQYLRSAEEMQQLFEDIPSALTNSVEIAKRCNLLITLGKVFLPAFPTPEGKSTEQHLTEQSEIGLQERLDKFLNPDDAEFSQKRKTYFDRLSVELDVINNIGFAGYFLIVADFIQWSKNHGIPVGPGRGSGAGSLVAYALKITDIDPLPYGLLFERFLNPERVSMPDFDVDFCMEGRDRVIEYVANHYGRDKVSQIITYGTMSAKAVVRDVGRVLGLPYGFVDKIAKLIPFELGITLDKALVQEAQLQQRYDEEEEVKTLIDLALKLEGLARNAGKHAGGVVVAPSALTDFTPLYCEPGSAQGVTQFDKDDIETIGLVKFDFLGLRTLTIIDQAVRTVNANKAPGETPLDISRLPMQDEATFASLKACATSAVFQLESRGMKDLIGRLQPDCFEEIIALVALFRPGPLQSGMVDDFINRKHGRAKVDYPHPSLEEILKETYGVILYQEQVMKIAQVLARYSLGSADLLRRAMGKKKPEEMAKQRTLFLSGSKDNGIPERLASQIFDLMEKFAGYGFNKSHSAAYALVSYQTAWLKVHYPAEFMAAVLSSDMDNTDKVVLSLRECKSMNLEILAADVNSSEYQFTVTPDKKIRYGLGAIKGVGQSAVENIIELRNKDGKFSSLFDFCKRVDLHKVNKRVFDSLIRSGSMDSLQGHRASLMASVEKAIQLATQARTNADRGQADLFGACDDVQDAVENQLINVPEWPEQIRLQGEKDSLGHYLSGHPVRRYQREFANFITCGFDAIAKEQSVTIAGLVTMIRTKMTRNNEKMAFLTLDDGDAQIDLVLFPELYTKSQQFLTQDAVIVVEGSVSLDEYTQNYRITCQRVLSMEQARMHYGKFLLMKFSAEAMIKEKLPVLKQIIQPHAGGKFPIQIQYQRDDTTLKLNLDQKWQVFPNNDLLEKLHHLLGDEAVSVIY